MKVKVDQLKCESNAVCVRLCPQIFRLQPGSNKAKVIQSLIPDKLKQKCREAMIKCPTGAISIEED